MSFLSRKPARPGSRGSAAGPADEYDDYDDYATDGYQSEEDGWSPGEYFSPEGIKGRWAGEQPEGRSGGRGRRDNGRGDSADNRDPFETGRDPFDATFGGYGKSEPRGGYGADEYATGAYELPEGADDDRQERGRRRRNRDGERTGILRLRRDRGEDIWPDDEVSDEDYWASVAADGPLNGAGAPHGDNHAPASGAARRTADPRPGYQQRGDRDQRGTDQRGSDQRGVTGRLGPPPGLSGDYQPGGAPGSGPMRGAGQPGGGSGPMRGLGQPGGGSGPMPARPVTGPTPVRSGTAPTPPRSATGPTPVRSGTGPTPARSGTGPTPTIGVTASRPPAGRSGMRPGPGTGPNASWQGNSQQRPGSGPGSGGFPQAAPRPSFQPNGHQPGGGPAGGRQQDRGDWGDRTERIERVNVSGYPDQRAGGRGPGTSGPGTPVPSGAPGRGRDDSGSWRTPDRREADHRREADRREADRREADHRRETDRRETDRREADHRREADRREAGRRDPGRDSGGWAAPARGGASAWSGADDDPLTSTAYSRSALAETDGRSYRMAARRSQAQAMLTEQAETFITGQYQSGHTGDYPAASFQSAEQRTGEYRQYQGNAPATAAQPAAGRYPAYGQDGHAAAGHQTQPPRSAHGSGGSGSGSGAAGWPAQPGGVPGGQYDARQPQQYPQAQPRQQASLSAAPLSAPVPSGDGPAPGSGAAAESGGWPSAKGGINPYDAALTGSYPYPGQANSAARPGPMGPAGPAQPSADDPYYRPLPADGYPSGGGDQGRIDPARAGYGASYGNGYQAPRDERY